MRRYSFFIPTLFCTIFIAQSQTRVTYDELQNGGWQAMQGKEVIITTPLIVCGTYYDSVTLAPERLYVPEERAIGLAEGDSTEYHRLRRYNDSLAVRLVCPRKFDLNLGATVRNLKVRIKGNKHVETGKIPNYRNYRPSKRLPKMNNADIIVCATNIENYFVHTGGYATRKITAGQHDFQCYKTASALIKLKADLYAICEIEKGTGAPEELTNMMNRLAGRNIYTFVKTDITDGDTISCGFIYDKRTIRPYGELRKAYPNSHNIFIGRFLLQGFEAVKNGERFVISLNHLRSKRGKPEESARLRNNNAEAILRCINEAYADSTYTDPDILLLGDYNSYTYEKPLQTIVQAGYEDLLMQHDSLGYSYSYKGECGYLDRVYASPTMAAQVTAVHPVHWNTDFYYSAAYSYKYNYRNNEIPKEHFASIRRTLSPTAKRNILFRFSDHDPLLIGIKLQQK